MPAGRRRWLPTATACVILVAASSGVPACTREGSDTKAQDSSTQSQSTQSQATDKPTGPVTGTAGRLPTLGDYIKQNNISEAQVRADDPNAPAITLPVLPDWKDTGAATPPYAYAGLINTDPATAADPPTIIVVFSKLEGADPAEILKLAPNEIRNLPEFNGDDEAKRAKLAGFDSVQIGGTYVRDGVTRLIGQKTVAIPGKDGLYVLQINADALKDQVVLLVTATDAMDRLATIKP